MSRNKFETSENKLAKKASQGGDDTVQRNRVVPHSSTTLVPDGQYPDLSLPVRVRVGPITRRVLGPRYSVIYVMVSPFPSTVEEALFLEEQE